MHRIREQAHSPRTSCQKIQNSLACFLFHLTRAIMAHSHRRQRTSPMSAAFTPPAPNKPLSNTAVTLQIVSIVFYTFVAFLCIGLPIAVIPGYVHDQLGFSALIAGLTIGTQYLATLLTRPRSEEHTSELQSHHDLVCR